MKKSLRSLRLVSFGSALLAGASLVSGCATSSEPIGVEAYRGEAVEQRGTAVERVFGNAKNRIDPADPSLTAGLFEPLRVYIVPAEVEAVATRGNALFNQSAAAAELTKLMAEKATQWGRFARVDDPSKANLLVSCRLSSLYLDGDWSKSRNELDAKYKGFFGVDLGAGQAEEKARDILNARLTIEYVDPRSNEAIQSTTVFGRLVKKYGEITEEAAVDGLPQGSTTDIKSTRSSGSSQAKGTIKEEMIPQLLGHSVSSAFAASFANLDDHLWASSANPQTPRAIKPRATAGVPGE